MALTTLSDLKSFLSITESSEDTLLNLLITEVSSLIEEYCGRVFASATYTEYYMGNGQTTFALNQRPVTSITSLYFDETAWWGSASGAFASGTLLSSGVDYALEIDQADGSSRSGLVYRIGGYWARPFGHQVGMISSAPVQVGNIKVTYVGGYSSVPSQIELACNMAIARVRNMAPYGQALTSEAYEEYHYSLSTGSLEHVLSGEVRSILGRYRNVSVA